MTTSLGYTDTISTPKSVSIPDLDYAHDFAVTKDTSEECILTNMTSPLDQPETLRFGYQNIADVYRNTGIDPSFMSTTKRGISVVSQVNDILRVIPDTDTTCCGDTSYDLPISAHVVVKVPVNANVTPDVVKTLVFRAVSTMFNTGKTDSTRIGELLRDALNPLR